jgi:hypothetical protein
MYQITDGNEHQRIENWNEMIATLESWQDCPDLGGIGEGDLAGLRAALKGSGYQVEEVA